ncbi:MAG: hypothetical protein JSS02_06405 [Planctomycetes bacterium]|nr:hypothetical protein [Planctomycetota bacterium]
MPRHPSRNPRLQDRDYEILQHVLRYRITTPEVLHRLFFDDSERNAVTKVTSRLISLDFLQSHPLFAGRTYLNLGSKGAKICGVSSRKTGSLGPQALYIEYGTLAYCQLGPVLRERMRVSDLSHRNPSLLARGLDSSHYYLDIDDGAKRFGLIRVDGGGDVAHVVRKCRQDIEAREEIPAFRELIYQGAFLIAVVTLSDEKRAALERELRTVATPVAFRVEVVPDLRQLLAAHYA